MIKKSADLITESDDHFLVRPDPAAGSPTRIDVSPTGTSVMVMRDDTDYFAREFGRCLSLRNAVASGGPEPAIAECYRLFQFDTRNAFRAVWRPAARLIFHLVDAQRLELAVRRRTRFNPLIILDPLMAGAPNQLHVSRGFLIGGRTRVALVPSPGSDPIDRQIASLIQYLGDEACTLVEDDVCTGRTISEVVRHLRTAGIQVQNIVPGIQLGDGPQDSMLGPPIDPILQYHAVRNALDDMLELTDPRNYLFGLSGLVISLPGANWGRAPYWLPFVSTSARIGVPVHNEREFAFHMLEANLNFFARVEWLVRRVIRVADLHPAVQRMALSLEIAKPQHSVRSVLETLMARMEECIERALSMEEREARQLAESAGR